MKVFSILVFTAALALAVSQESSSSVTPTTSNEPTKPTTPDTNSTTTDKPTSSTTTSTPTTSTTTTTVKPTTTPTPQPTPTTVAPPTPKEPTLGNYTVEDKDNICLVALMKVTVQKLDTKIPIVNGTVEKDGSKCGKDSIELMITFPQGKLNFKLSNNNESYYISEIAIDTPEIVGVNSTLEQFSVALGSYYKCTSVSTVQLGNNITMIFEDMRLEAFRTDKTANFVGKQVECVSDYHSDVVIIAIGSALALLIVIILVAYLIARRRNRQRGYQSV